MQQTFLQQEFDYTCENKCKQLCSKCGKFYYTHSAKHAVTAYKKYHRCLNNLTAHSAPNDPELSTSASNMMGFDVQPCANILF
jgi:hypothetical protein